RPSLGETAIAVDREGGLGDRAASALALAVAFPHAAGVEPVTPPEDGAGLAKTTEPGLEEERRTFVRRQRLDAVASLRTTPTRLFRPRFSRRPAAAAFIAVLLLAPVLLLPNPQVAAIAQAR